MLSFRYIYKIFNVDMKEYEVFAQKVRLIPIGMVRY